MAYNFVYQLVDDEITTVDKYRLTCQNIRIFEY